MKKTKNPAMTIGILMSAAYFASYLTRGNMNAVISEICRALRWDAAQAAPIVSLGFWSYGVGQLLWGYWGRKIPAKGLMLGGLAVSGVLNLVIPAFSTVTALGALWFVNGLAQAAIWPPMSQIMACGIPRKTVYDKACTAVTMAGVLATFALYLVSPLLIRRQGYEAVFYVCGGMALAAAAAVAILGKTIPAPERESARIGGQAFGGGALVGLLLALSFLAGMLREGINAWLPTLLCGVYGLETSSAIFSTLVLPLVGLVSMFLTGRVLVRVFRSEIRTCGALFVLGLAASGILALLLGKSGPILAVALASLLVGGMYGTHMILTGLVLPSFAGMGSIIFLSGLLNFVSYIGAAVSSWMFPQIAELGGWQGTVCSWAGICLLGTATALGLEPRWGRFQAEKQK